MVQISTTILILGVLWSILGFFYLAIQKPLQKTLKDALPNFRGERILSKNAPPEMQVDKLQQQVWQTFMAKALKLATKSSGWSEAEDGLTIEGILQEALKHPEQAKALWDAFTGSMGDQNQDTQEWMHPK